MIKCISFLWRRSPGAVAMVVAGNIVSGFSMIGLLVLINIVLQGRPVSRELLIWSFVGFCLLAPLSRCSAELLLTRLAQDSLFDLQIHLARKIAGAPLRYLEDLGIPRLLAVLTQDLQVLTEALVFVPITCVNFTIIACGMIYLCWLSRMVSVAILGFIVLSSVIYRLATSKAAESLHLARTATDGLYRHLRSLLKGSKELKLHQRRRRAFFSQVLHSSASAVRDHSTAGLAASIGAGAWVQMSGFVLIGALLLAIPLLKLNLQDRIGYTTTLIFILGPVQMLLNRVSSFNLAEVALHKIEDLERNLTALYAEVDSGLPQDPPFEFERLGLIDVTHAYRRDGEIDNFIVGPVSLSLVPGEVVFLVGGNGSGKTTLAKLLVGLYVPAEGEICLNGQIITDANREYYRQHFSVVFADFHLFDRLLGLDGPELDRDARKYLARLELDHVVEIKNGTLSTTQLSQGQRKRLALLTAYMEDRPIYVFDEWAADQDPAFKKIFYHSFLPALKAKGKAVLVISHDERYYNVADRVIHLDCGRITELPLHLQSA
jgi:putative pyoverdin transport system ATP-binding/permease protein